MYGKRIKKNNPNVNKQVLRFIKNFTTHAAATEKEYEIIRQTFRTGYCWHFAHLLKTTFGRGEVCWAAPFGHFIWLDNETPYDIEGVYYGESLYFIPESYRRFVHAGIIIKTITFWIGINQSDRFTVTNYIKF